jgi:hypothetical protein
MQKTPLLHTVTNLYSLIFNNNIFNGRRSRGSSSSKNSKMYRKIAPIQEIDRIFSALDFTVTTVTNIIIYFIIIINIIELVIVTVKIKDTKKAVAVTNCHILLQTVTSLSHATVTRYNYYINHITISFSKNL